LIDVGVGDDSGGDGSLIDVGVGDDSGGLLWVLISVKMTKNEGGGINPLSSLAFFWT
jgi:hypothetical protein